MLSIKEMSSINKAIYSKSNENLDFEYMYAYLTRKIAYLSRGFLRNNAMDNEEVMNTFIQSLSWLFSICDKLDIDPQESFYKKFPSCCPYCLSQPCTCTQTHRKPEKIRSAVYIKSELESRYRSGILGREKDLSPTKMINNIYPSNKNIWGVFGGFYHSARLFEELGELHEAYSRLQEDKSYNPANLHEECADIFAWLYSLWGINFTKENEELDIKFEEYYMNGCPVCHQHECTCVPYSGRITITEDKRTLLIQLVDNISQLIKDEEFKAYESELNSALTGLDDAIKSGRDIDSRRTINEVESLLSSVNKNTGHVSSIFNNIVGIIATFRTFTGL